MNRTLPAALLCGTTALFALTTALSAGQQPARAVAPAIEVLPVAGSVFLMAGSGANVLVQASDEGALVVDTSTEAVSDRLIEEVRKLTKRPLRYVINTTGDADHVGGNDRIASAGLNFASSVPNVAGVGAGRVAAGGGAGGNNNTPRTTGAQVYAHEAVLNRMSAETAGKPAMRFDLWPTDTFFTQKKTLYFNDEPIELLHQPAAHSDGDIFVWFRRSDVIAAGDTFTPDRFPMIDLSRGGSVNGMIEALNRIIDITVPRFNQQGGTLVVGGHGRIGNESDVVEYRDMATIVRDRIQMMIANRMTLEQVQAANPVRDYEGIYGRNTTWTRAMFVEAIYRDLSKSATAPRGSR